MSVQFNYEGAFMQMYRQQFKHDPENGIYGDCFRTAIACLLNKTPDDVPHFLADDAPAEKFNADVAAYLKSQGLLRFSIPYAASLQETMNCMLYQNPNILYMLCGTSPRGCNHVVIAVNDHILWDTSQEGGGLVAPCADGYYWIEVLLPAEYHAHVW